MWVSVLSLGMVINLILFLFYILKAKYQYIRRKYQLSVTLN